MVAARTGAGQDADREGICNTEGSGAPGGAPQRKSKAMKQILGIVMMIGGLMAGCVSMNPYALPTPQPQREEWGMTRVRETIRRTQLPNSYKEQIDEQVVAQLKDPDSRKIAYLANPYGSLICGTINAKNSYGGYVGAQPFHAYFTPDGHIGNLSIFTPKD